MLMPGNARPCEGLAPTDFTKHFNANVAQTHLGRMCRLAVDTTSPIGICAAPETSLGFRRIFPAVYRPACVATIAVLIRAAARRISHLHWQDHHRWKASARFHSDRCSVRRVS